MPEFLTYGGLFAVSLIAATLFPLQSEAVLAGLLIAGREPAWALIAVASAGNVAGVLREPLPSFLAIVTIAKVGRYLAVAWLVPH
jgi:membrane protein YqaA with SNARE-associated domain